MQIQALLQRNSWVWGVLQCVVMTSELVHYLCTQSCPLWWLGTMMHWGRLNDGWINRDRLLTQSARYDCSLTPSSFLSINLSFCDIYIYIPHYYFVLGLLFSFGFVSLSSSIFSFFKLLFYAYIIPSTLFLSSSFLRDPLYDDVISTRLRRLCGERLCHAHPHSSCWVGRMRRMELREYVWPPSPLSNEMNTVTHSQLCTLHGVDSKDRSIPWICRGECLIRWCIIHDAAHNLIYYI